MKTLDEYGRIYCDYNQKERESDKILEKQGHPGAEEYRELRDFFDSLVHFANASARFYSFADENENTQYWAPELHIRRHVWDSGRPLFPRDGEKYLQALENIDVADHDPYLHGGSWLIKTRNEDFFNAIESLNGVEDITVTEKGVPKGHSRISVARTYPRPTEGHFRARIYLDGVEQFRAVKKVIDRFVEPLSRGDGDKAIQEALEERSETEDKKPICYANVPEVTEEEYRTLIPQVPLGYNLSSLFAATIAYDLKEIGYDEETILHYCSVDDIEDAVEAVEKYGRVVKSKTACTSVASSVNFVLEES